jgi:alpha-1,3-glucan synthase
MAKLVGFLFSILATSVLSLKYDPREEAYNLNTNKEAQHPLDYTGQWEHHTYHPSPDNWRLPFYTLFLDRYVNGDPSNDNANGTIFEQDVMETQFRHGGDLAGLIDSLDYIQGIGIKVKRLRPLVALHHVLTRWVQAIYVAGTPYVNSPWKSDGYSVRRITVVCQPTR